MHYGKTYVLLLIPALFLSACAPKDGVLSYMGASYPPSDKVTVAFQPGQVVEKCNVFAHILVTFPEGVNGKNLAEAASLEAKGRGADIVLIGQSRVTDEDSELAFYYFGPEYEYSLADRWAGWKYGYDLWEEQGGWVGVGYNEWDNHNVVFDTALMLQLAFLKCE